MLFYHKAVKKRPLKECCPCLCCEKIISEKPVRLRFLNLGHSGVISTIASAAAIACKSHCAQSQAKEE